MNKNITVIVISTVLGVALVVAALLVFIPGVRTLVFGDAANTGDATTTYDANTPMPTVQPADTPTPVVTYITEPRNITGEFIELAGKDGDISGNLFTLDGDSKAAYKLEDGKILEVPVQKCNALFEYKNSEYKFSFDYALDGDSFLYLAEGDSNVSHDEPQLINGAEGTCIITILSIEDEHRISIYEVFILELNTGKLTRFIDNSSRTVAEDTIIPVFWAVANTLSPDGTKLLFHTNRDTYIEEKSYDYYIYDFNTEAEHKIDVPVAFVQDNNKHWSIKRPESVWWHDNDTVILDYFYSVLDVETRRETGYQQYVVHNVVEGSTIISDASRINCDEISPNKCCVYAVSIENSTFTFFNRLTDEYVVYKDELSAGLTGSSYQFYEGFNGCVLSFFSVDIVEDENGEPVEEYGLVELVVLLDFGESSAFYFERESAVIGFEYEGYANACSYDVKSDTFLFSVYKEFGYFAGIYTVKIS